MQNTAAPAAATRTGHHYAIAIDGQTVAEFNDKRTFDFVVIGRSTDGHTNYWRTWNVWAKTNQPRGAEQKWTVWGRRQVNAAVEVLVVTVEHL